MSSYSHTFVRQNKFIIMKTSKPPTKTFHVAQSKDFDLGRSQNCDIVLMYTLFKNHVLYSHSLLWKKRNAKLCRPYFKFHVPRWESFDASGHIVLVHIMVDWDGLYNMFKIYYFILHWRNKNIFRKENEWSCLSKFDRKAFGRSSV